MRLNSLLLNLQNNSQANIHEQVEKQMAHSPDSGDRRSSPREPDSRYTISRAVVSNWNKTCFDRNCQEIRAVSSRLVSSRLEKNTRRLDPSRARRSKMRRNANFENPRRETRRETSRFLSRRDETARGHFRLEISRRLNEILSHCQHYNKASVLKHPSKNLKRRIQQSVIWFLCVFIRYRQSSSDSTR